MWKIPQSVFCIAREVQARRNSEINESDQGITLGKIYLAAKKWSGIQTTRVLFLAF